MNGQHPKSAPTLSEGRHAPLSTPHKKTGTDLFLLDNAPYVQAKPNPRQGYSMQTSGISVLIKMLLVSALGAALVVGVVAWYGHGTPSAQATGTMARDTPSEAAPAQPPRPERAETRGVYSPMAAEQAAQDTGATRPRTDVQQTMEQHPTDSGPSSASTQAAFREFQRRVEVCQRSEAWMRDACIETVREAFAQEQRRALP